MSKEMEIKKIVLKLNDKEVSLTIDEAKKLKELLSELFGKDIIKEVVKEEHHYHDHYRPYWYYNEPYWSSNTVLWSSNTSSLANAVNYASTSGTLTLNATC